MLDINLLENQNEVQINISDYVSKEEMNKFLINHKKLVKDIDTSKYRLVIIPSDFKCESEKELKKICISFYKVGYKKLYLLDPNNFIFSNVNLNSFEKNIFKKVVNIVNERKEIK